MDWQARRVRMYENHNKIPCACLRNTKMKTCMTQMCSLRHQRLNTAGRVFFFSSQIDTVHKNNKTKECYMDGDCSVDCEKTVLCVCVCILATKVSYTAIACICDTEQRRGKRKSTSSAGDTVDARPCLAQNQCAAHSLAAHGALASAFLGVGREIGDGVFSLVAHEMCDCSGLAQSTT